MIFAAVFLMIAGLLMLLKPNLVWSLTEKWKTTGAAEPSTLYVWSIRFGGVMCLLGGLAAAATYWFAL